MWVVWCFRIRGDRLGFEVTTVLVLDYVVDAEALRVGGERILKSVWAMWIGDALGQ